MTTDAQLFQIETLLRIFEHLLWQTDAELLSSTA